VTPRNATVSGRVAAVLVTDPATRAALQRLRSVDPETRATIDALFLAARHRARNFAAGIRTTSDSGSRADKRECDASKLSRGNSYVRSTSYAYPVLMSTAEAGRAAGVSPRAITSAITSGRLFAVRVGGRWAVPTDAITMFAATRTDGGADVA
jgi:hypothetical protein